TRRTRAAAGTPISNRYDLCARTRGAPTTVAERNLGGSRRGREMRGPLLPPTVPGWRSRAERFDMAVLEAYEPIERRWQDRVSGLDVAVDEIPRISPKDPEAVQWPPEVVADGPIALARLIPGGSISEATRRGRELCCSASRSSDGQRTPSSSPSCCMKSWWLRWPRIWASNLLSSTRRSTTSDAFSQMIPRLSRRRSRSDRPPQMPKRSSWASAYSRHRSRTSQPRQIRLASRVEPPFSGKNASGSVWAHNPR